MIVPAVLLPSMVGMLLGIAPMGEDPAAGFPKQVDRPAEQADQVAGMIRFRRVLAPQDRMKDWPLGGERYLPMDAAEFERLVGAMKPRDAKHPAVPSVAVVAAQYHARLTGGRLIGKAVLDVVLARDGPVALTLEPCNAALGNARWRSAADKLGATAGPSGSAENTVGQANRGTRADGDSTAAVLGLTGEGKLAVLVEKSGRLEFDWSLAARRDSGDVLCFAFELPPAVANRLFVELPKESAPSVDRGLITGSEPSGERSRRWRIELGRLGRFNLLVVPAGVEAGRPLALLRESRTYDCSLRGLEVSAQWKLQAHNEPLERVTVLLDPGLRLVSARLGESMIPWSTASAADGGSTQIELRLPEPIRDAERVIRLGAIGPVVLDRKWRLPRIRCKGLLWQEGGVTLLAPEPLVVDRIEPLGCVQTGAGPLSAPRVGHSAQFQCFDPDATVEVLMAVRPVDCNALKSSGDHRGLSQFSRREGRCLGKSLDRRENGTVPLAPREGDRSMFSANRLPAKRIFQPKNGPVPSQPVNAYHDVSPVPQAARYSGTIRITAEVGNRAVRETCLLRCVPEAGQVERVLVRLAPSRPTPPDWTLDGRGDGQFTARRWSDQERAAAGGDPSIETWELTLRRPRNVPFEIAAVRETIIKPRPSVAPHNSLLKKCATAGLSSSAEENSRKNTAGQASSGTQTPGDQLFQRADNATDGRGFMDISLASLPEATDQQGTIIVHGLGAKVLNVENRRLQPILPESPPPERVQTIRGAYRYDPVEDVGRWKETAIRISEANDPAVTSAWVWNLRLESWYQHGATARHLATYEMQSVGRRRLELTLPPGTDRENIHGVWVGGDAVTWQVVERGRQRLVSVELPAERKYPRVAVEWTTVEPRLGIVGTLSAAPPEPDLPVLARNWTVRLPPGYESADPRASASTAAVPQGWTAWRMDVSDSSPTTLRYARRDSMRLFGVVAFLLVAAAGCWKPNSQLKKSVSGISGATAGLSSSVFSGVSPCTAGQASSGTLFQQSANGPLKKGGVYLPLAALGLFAAAAMVVPGEYVPLAWGGALGAVFCLAWRWIRRPVREIHPVQLRHLRDHSDSTVSMASPLGLFFLAVPFAIFGCGLAFCADGPKGIEAESLYGERLEVQQSFPSEKNVSLLPVRRIKFPSAAAPAYRVFVPIDARRKPVGGKVYVPERFYQELHRHAAAAGKPPAWMILGATYRGDLTREGAAGRMAAGNLRAQYDLRVFEPGVLVRLPLRAEGAAFLSGSSLLDGRPIEPHGESDAAVLVVEIAEPGQYRLELSLRPTMHNDGVSGGFDLPIPRVPAARLELTLPDGAPPVEVPSARGGVLLGEGSRLLKAELGPADRLSVRWQEDLAPGGAGPAVEVEQLVWLKVQPGSVLIEVKFKFHSVEGRIQQVRLAVDPRLRLLPLAGEDPPVAQVGAESGNVRPITFRWSRPISDEATLEATLLLGGASGVGNVPLPKIELLDFQPVRNWAAFSVDPSLDHDQQLDEPLEPVAVADFLQAWGEADSTPQAAFRLAEGQAGWTLSTRPHQPRGTVDQNLTLSFDEDRVGVLFDASLSVASGYVFQHRLTAPKELEVESVSVLEDDIERVQRWSRDDEGTITIFLGGPASGTQKLALRGWLPIGTGRQWPLPAMRVGRCELRSATIRLFRRPAVLLEVQGEEGEQLILDDISPAAPDAAKTACPLDLGRLVRTIRWDGVGRPPAAVLLRPNRPKVGAEQVVRMQDDGRRWSARAEFRLTVGDGLLDEIRIHAPAPWNGPYEADKPGVLQVRDVPGEGRCIVFRPREAVSADFTFAISGPLELAPGDRPSVPDLRLLGIDKLKRRIVLPSQNGNRTYRWWTRGLKSVEGGTAGLSSSVSPGVSPRTAGQASSGTLFQRAAKSPPATCCYEVSGKQYRASLDSVAVVGVAGSVRLADVALAWQSDGRLRGAAVLEIEPGGVAQRSLRLPDGCELIQATVAGMPALPRRIDDNLWRLSLASADEPQRIEVVFCGLLPEADRAGRVRFDAPTLADMPVRRTRWTVGVPAGWLVSDPQGAAAADPWKPADVLRRTIGGSQRTVFQYESADGGTTLSLDCRPAHPARLPRYLAGVVALAALALLGLSVLYRREKK